MVQQRDVSCPRRFVKTYEELKKDDSIHITKADKTAALVIMDREDYNRKMTIILSDDTTYERICGDPTEKVNSNFNLTFKKIVGNKSHLTNSFIKPCCKLPLKLIKKIILCVQSLARLVVVLIFFYLNGT